MDQSCGDIKSGWGSFRWWCWGLVFVVVKESWTRHPRGELVRFYSVGSIEKIKRRVIKLSFLTCDQKLCLSLFELGQGVSTRVSVFVMEAIDVRAS